MENVSNERIEQLMDYIMKHCLWQFHSRKWDRERQNGEILAKTTRILCGEPVDHETPFDKCYWVDAVVLADAFRKRFSWISTLTAAETGELMAGLRERLDFLTITGSLNEELTVALY